MPPHDVFACPEGGEHDWKTEEEFEATRCKSTRAGDRCAYALHHDGAHWTIHEDGEETWTEESVALFDIAEQLRRLVVAVTELAERKAEGK